MDVRCEKCLTVYELDDAKVGDAGLTVKCQECGNLFKVRRRHDTADLVVRVAADDAGDNDDTDADRAIVAAPTSSLLSSSSSSGLASDAGSSVPPEGKPAEERGWMLRAAGTLEVVRFRELTTLQQWIVERKVTRKDEISRGGENWKALGGIAELASFFHVVEQAAAVAHASQPGLAVQRGARDEQELPELPTEILPQTKRPRDARDTGPTQMGRAGGSGGTGEGPNELGQTGSIAVDDSDAGGFGDERSRRTRPTGALVFLVLVTVAAVASAGYYARRASLLSSGFSGAAPGSSGSSASSSGADEAKARAELAQRGRTALLADTDDGFRQAISALDRALELDAPGAASAASRAVRADLGEAHVTWAAYLLEDAHRLEVGAGTMGGAGAQAARTLRAEAQAHLERARHVLEEAGGVEAAKTSAPLARAFGDLIRVEEGPIASAEESLQRAVKLGAGDDLELAYALGELRLRQGQLPEALTLLAKAANGDGLVRAHYRLAALAREAGRVDDLRRECEALTQRAPKHDRAHALCAAEAALTPADLGAAAKPPSGGDELAPPRPREAVSPPTDYKSLVKEADRLSENGRSKEARKLYEKAIELDPRGVAALTGLGYCDLDAERFLQAVDRFNAALAIDPSSGDAVVGLAESYKVRGQLQRAVDQYKKYLSAHPTGPKASMAQKNLRDLEPKLSKEADGKDPDRSDATKERTKKDDALPRPPPEEQPSP